MKAASEELERAAAALAASHRAVIASGAGMSKECGIPTFREALNGLWARFKPQELATRDAFREDPARVWGWYNYRRGIIARSVPHAGYEATTRLESLLSETVVVTQNIDGLHARAGSTSVLELHGNIHRLKCFERDHPASVEPPLADVLAPAEPPTCEVCGSFLRPDVVWYGEALPFGVLERAEAMAESCDVMLVVGTSGLVYPAAALPLVARSHGALVIEVNVRPSELTRSVDIFLEGPAGKVLPELVSRIERGRS